MNFAVHSPKIAELIQALQALPGVGPKTAQRMTLQLLEHQQEPAKTLAYTLLDALECITHCEQCHMITETPTCQICSSPRREPQILCVVGSPSDVIAIEQSGGYHGLYFVLKGHLSPIDGIGPDDIGIDKLVMRCQDFEIKEIVLATNSTVEGEATAHYIMETIKTLPIQASRIAHGIPMGGELEYIDAGTIARAIQSRSHVA